MIPLRRATAIAEKVSAKLAPHCERIEIAGSIRREVATVGDIDLVILPRDRKAIDAAVQERCTVEKNGPQFLLAIMEDGTQLDLWFARGQIESDDLFDKKILPPNFGSLLLCRTGSKEHNVSLVRHAHSRSLRWHPHDGVMRLDGTVIASETEEAIFDALDSQFIEPKERRYFVHRCAQLPPRFEK